MFVVMLCLIAVIAILTNCSGVGCGSAAVRAAERRLQAQWLAEAGSSRGAQLAKDSAYHGRKVTVRRKTWASRPDCQIRVTSSNKIAKAHNIEVTADFSPDLPIEFASKGNCSSDAEQSAQMARCAVDRTRLTYKEEETEHGRPEARLH